MFPVITPPSPPQWHTHTNLLMHTVSRCTFQWLKGAIALVNLSFASTYRPAFSIVLGICLSGCYTHLGTGPDTQTDLLASLPQLAKMLLSSPTRFLMFFLCLSIILSVSACCLDKCKCGPRYALVISYWKSCSLVASYSLALVTGHW